MWEGIRRPRDFKLKEMNAYLCKTKIESELKENGVPAHKAELCLRLLGEHGFLGSISSFRALNRGMTNELFYFMAGGKEYLIRVPGEGSEYLLDRSQEARVYKELRGMDITDRYVCIDPSTGFKITEYIADAHTCDTRDMDEVGRCIRHLRALHERAIKTEKVFDPFEMLEHYERSCMHDISRWVPDYAARRSEVAELKELIDSLPRRSVLCHVDPVHENFLIRDGDIFLIDWEYAAQADPDMDIAMFCIYAGYGKEEIDTVAELYYPEGCDERTRIKIYCYAACCALLWVVWCEIKRDSGILFDSYEKMQYDYIRRFYETAKAGFAQLSLNDS